MKREKEDKPAKVTLERLRHHFKSVYRLADDQVETMVLSSARSLNISLASLFEALDNDIDLSEISRVGHSIKGLLLNMGEQQWAELARELETSAASGLDINYRKLVDEINKGVEDILKV